MNISDKDLGRLAGELLRYLINSVKSSEYLTLKLNHLREGDETDFNVLDRLLSELEERTDSDGTIDELREKVFELEEDCRVLAEKLNKTSSELRMANNIIHTLREDYRRLDTLKSKENTDDFTVYEWQVISASLESYVAIGRQFDALDPKLIEILPELRKKLEERGK